jgi:hypothetical protein
MIYSLLFHGDSYLANALQCYVKRTFPVLFAIDPLRIILMLLNRQRLVSIKLLPLLSSPYIVFLKVLCGGDVEVATVRNWYIY